uniref:Uncharacterized protein n=1 Tax=Manihot esculenta TaxID=3983 RepID=A0A2C9UVW9_MANES
MTSNEVTEIENSKVCEWEPEKDLSLHLGYVNIYIYLKAIHQNLPAGEGRRRGRITNDTSVLW